MRSMFVVVMVVMMAAVSFAGPDQGAKSDGFWNTLSTKLQKIAPTKRTTATTAVGGVRGAKNDEAADIYWKGKAKTVEVGEDELEKLKAGLDAKAKGESAQALKQFEEFLRDFPKSTLKADCLEAIEQLKSEQTAKK